MSRYSMPSSSDEPGARLEVAIERLDGIALVSDRDRMVDDMSEILPHVTATVAFSGSAANMTVRSSAVCSRTGQLLVESKPLILLDRRGDDEKNQCWLSAEWEEEALGSGEHLMVQLPRRDSKLPKAKLSKSNRDSFIEAVSVLGDEFDTQTIVTCCTASTAASRQTRDTERGVSAIWSNSALAMPEIIELSIRLKSPGQDFVEQVGIAYLVIFGNEEDRGTFVMELPVKEPTSVNASNERSSLTPSVIFTKHTRLKVRVRMIPAKKKRKSPLPMLVTSSLSFSSESEEIHLSNSIMEHEVGALLEKIKENEKAFSDLRKAQKNAMDVEVPVNGVRYAENRPFCDASLWSWSSLVKTLYSAVRCDAGPGVMKSDASTIFTRDSMEI